MALIATGDTVYIALTGATTANSAACHFTFVLVAADGALRYAGLAAVKGTATAESAIPPVSGERLYLAFTAMPYTCESLGWQPDGPVLATPYPYTVTITGATPRTAS